MHPKIQVVHGHIGPDVAHLLLARSPDLFDVVEILFDRGAIGKRFQDPDGGGMDVGTEEGVPKVIFPDQHHTDGASHGQRREAFP